MKSRFFSCEIDVWFIVAQRMKTKTIRSLVILFLLMYIGSLIFSVYDRLFVQTDLIVGWVKQANGDLEIIRALAKEQNQTIVWQLGLQTVFILVTLILITLSYRIKGAEAKVVYVEKYVGRESDKSASSETGRKVALAKRIEELQAQLANQAPSDMAALALRHCCNDLEAVTGAYFVAKKENNASFVEMAAGFANPLPETGRPRFAPGEGITGQTFQDGREHLVTDVPADYLPTTSGLGKAKPGFVLAIPVVHHAQVKGVIEIGTFRQPDEVAMAYLRQLAQLLGQYTNEPTDATTYNYSNGNSN